MNAVESQSESFKLECLLAAVQLPEHTPLETAEAAELALRQAFRLGDQDASDRDTLLTTLCQLDAWLATRGVDAFARHPLLEKAYAKMGSESPEVFWSRAFPKLEQIRDALYAALYKEIREQEA